MAIARRDRSGRRSTGLQSSTIVMGAGLLVAALAAALVFFVAQQSRATVQVPVAVREVDVVVMTQDVGEGSVVPPTAVAIKSFPPPNVPPGAPTGIDQVAGKFATTHLTRDQIVLASQVTATRPVINPTAAIPLGKVALWMPIPELVAQSGSLRAGDKVDILVSLLLAADPTTGQGAGLTTQTTLTNVELLYVGTPPAESSPTVKDGQVVPAPAGVARMVLFVVDPQDALFAKFTKDAGATVDFAVRSRESQDMATTVAVDARSFAERFNFRR